MADDSAELLVSIRADIEDLKSKFSEAKDSSSEFTDHVSDGLGDVGAMIAEVFAADKIKDFFKEGVKGFADFDLSLRTTELNLTRLGQATGDDKEKLESWAQTIQATTLFTKEEAVEAVNRLVVSTGNLGDALKLSSLAMDVSAAAHVPLEQAALALGNAMEGNYQGLGRFTRAFPQLKQAIAEGKDPIQWLEEHAKGTAEALGSQGMAGELFHAKMEMQDLGEEFAKENQGPITDAIHGFEAFTKGLGDFIHWIVELDQQFAIRMASIVLRMESLASIPGLIMEKGLGWVHPFMEQWQRDSKLVDAEMAETMEKVGEKAGKKFSDGLTTGFLHAKKEFKKKNDDLTREANESEINLDEDAEKKKEALHQAEVEVSKKALDDITTLSQGANNTQVEIRKQAAAATAIINTAEAVTQALGAYPPPYDFVMAGLVGVAGAAQIAKIESTSAAEGGIFTQPTLVQAGDGGEPEGFFPLSKSKEMGFGGGDTGDVHFHFPGVTNRQEAQAAGQSAALAFIKTQQGAKIRSGNRNTSF